jgi:hypothetical protein
MIAHEIKVKPKTQLATMLFLSAMGLFAPLMREMVEMLYRYDRHYVFISKKFEDRFDTKPTP